MGVDTFGEFRPATDVVGRFHSEYNLQARWFPNKIDAFSTALEGVSITWNHCKFTQHARVNVPDKFGVYCFTADIGGPFPRDVKVMVLYIGKASEQYLSERFDDYLVEINSVSARAKVGNAFQKYKSSLVFWWCVLPSIHVEVVERHLLMCYEPPANEQFPKAEKHWGKAFTIQTEE